MWLKFGKIGMIFFSTSSNLLQILSWSYLDISTWTIVPVSKKHLNMYLCMFLGSENQWHCKTDVYWRKENKLLGGLLLESTIPAPAALNLLSWIFHWVLQNWRKHFKLKMLHKLQRWERTFKLLLSLLSSGKEIIVHRCIFVWKFEEI